MNYEEEYKHALENFKKIKSANSDNKELVDFIEFEYPELRESEDEKIIRTLKEIVNWGCAKNISVENDVSLEDCISWLEKQGEQKPVDKTKPKFKVGDVIKNIKNGDTIKVEQISNNSYCYSGWDGAATIHSDFLISDQDDWELIKPAWSEEDEYQINTILHGLDLKRELYKKEGNKVEEERYKTQYDWLKSIKPNHWKPSEEQMQALFEAKLASIKNREYFLGLLYEDLKKL